jgi:hypothetical protein
MQAEPDVEGGATRGTRPDPTTGKGKRRGNRVLYAFLADHGIALLIAAWAKSEREDLQLADYKAIGKMIARVHTLLNEGRTL